MNFSKKKKTMPTMLSRCQWYLTDLRIEQSSSHGLTSFHHLSPVPYPLLHYIAATTLVYWLSFFLPAQTSPTIWRTLFTSASSHHINSCSFVKISIQISLSLRKALLNHLLDEIKKTNKNLCSTSYFHVFFLHTNPSLSLYFHLCDYLHNLSLFNRL